MGIFSSKKKRSSRHQHSARDQHSYQHTNTRSTTPKKHRNIKKYKKYDFASTPDIISKNVMKEHAWASSKKDQRISDKNKLIMSMMSHNFNIKQIISFWIRNIDNNNKQIFKLSKYILNNDILGLLCKYSVRTYQFIFTFGSKQLSTKSILHQQIFVQNNNLYLLNFQQKIIKDSSNNMFGQANIFRIIDGNKNDKRFDEIIISTGLASEHCLIIKNNQIYGLGRNHYGQLGINKKSFSEEIPIKLSTKFDSKIISIKCGSDHSLFLSYYGFVYSCGHNDYGQLGLSLNITPNKVSYTIQRIKHLNDISEIGCTRWTSFATKDGNIYSWGANDCGLLGLNNGDVTKKAFTPAIISSSYFANYNIIQIKCGICHVIILNANYDAYVWGQALSIGIGSKRGMQTYPKGLLRNIKSIACGDYHSILQTFDDDLYVFGKNKMRQCLGLKDENILKPKLILKDQILHNHKHTINNIDFCSIHVYGATGTTLIGIE